MAASLQGFVSIGAYEDMPRPRMAQKPSEKARSCSISCLVRLDLGPESPSEFPSPIVGSKDRIEHVYMDKYYENCLDDNRGFCFHNHLDVNIICPGSHLEISLEDVLGLWVIEQ